jgi:methylated-DNA-protein-cysteine methyltransferase-like protein
MDNQRKEHRKVFRSPPDPAGYDRQVWEIVRAVPAGRVVTYGGVAGLIPLPEGVDPQSYLAYGARWVGGALVRCPADVPWQRVINARGEISPRPGAELQRSLLEQEGVEFDPRGRTDLQRFGWPDGQQPGQLQLH